MEKWLTETIPGIVILGALGSLFSVAILYALRLVPLPLRWHSGRITKQAYMLGYSAAVIDKDKTGRALAAALIYHLTLLVIYLMASFGCGILFLIFLSIQVETVVTWGIFLLLTAFFTFIYLTYFEFEFIYRTYLFYWGSPLDHANKAYASRPNKSEASDEPNNESAIVSSHSNESSASGEKD